MKLKIKDIMKINQLFEVAEENDTTIVIGKKGHNLYMMNSAAYDKLVNQKSPSIREKEIRNQSGKTSKKSK